MNLKAALAVAAVTAGAGLLLYTQGLERKLERATERAEDAQAVSDAYREAAQKVAAQVAVLEASRAGAAEARREAESRISSVPEGGCFDAALPFELLEK